MCLPSSSFALSFGCPRTCSSFDLFAASEDILADSASGGIQSQDVRAPGSKFWGVSGCSHDTGNGRSAPHGIEDVVEPLVFDPKRNASALQMASRMGATACGGHNVTASLAVSRARPRPPEPPTNSSHSVGFWSSSSLSRSTYTHWYSFEAAFIELNFC